MRHKEITYSETFPMSNGHFQKIIDVIELQEGDDPKKALYEAKKTVTQFFYESNKAAENKEQEAITNVEPKLSRQEAIIRDIGTVKEVIVLESYQMIAKADPLIKEAYDNKLKELKNG